MKDNSPSYENIDPDYAHHAWEDIFHAIGHPTIILDPHHKVLAANNASIKLTGKSSDEIVGKQCYEIFHGKDIKAPPEDCPMEKMLKSNHLETVEMEMESLGSHFLVSCTPVFDERGNLKKIIHIATDITERKRAETHFRTIFENAIDGILLADTDSKKFFTGNKAICKMLGYTSDEIPGLSVFDIHAPEDLPYVLEQFNRLARKEMEVAYGIPVKKKDGSIFYADISASPVEVSGNQYLIGFFRDVTEHIKSDESFKESEERFRILLDHGFDGIFIHENLIILELNQRMADITGYSQAELLNSRVIDLFTPESQKRIYDYIQSGRKGYYEVELMKSDGSVVEIEAFGAPCRFHGRDARIVAIRDITEQKKLQEQFRQAQKMEAIGHLAGGIAHDFNNILSAIVGYAHLTLLKMDTADPLRMNIQQIMTATEKAANLTQSLLAFSRKQVIDLKSVNLNDIVWGIQKILERIIGEDIEFRVITAGNDLIVNADKSQIEQALMNLATNARDAMPLGGSLTITTNEFEIDEGFIRMHKYGEKGMYAVLTVADTGTGMDETTRRNIFDPFFTTKEVGKGTGLGLAMVYGTIKQHSGFIDVYSEPGEGTNFRIYLPLSEYGSAPLEKKESTLAVSGNETILLIEDDNAVRTSTKFLLEEFGYTVLEAFNGEQAISLFTGNKDLVHLVITDVIMPGQSGREVFEQLIKIKSDVKVLFMSGYSTDILANKGMFNKGVSFTSKPVKPDTLLTLIREALDKKDD